MNRILLLAVTFAFFTASEAAAQPRNIESQPPLVSIRTLEESAELIEANLEVKGAYVKAAEVGVTAAKAKYNRLAELKAGGVANSHELDGARIDVDAALAQLNIRKAELREVEVRLKQVKKRLEESKPAAVPAPKKVLPLTRPNVDPAAAIAEAAVEAAKARGEKAKAAITVAQADLARIKKLVEAGIVAREDFLRAQTAVTIAELDLLVAQTELKAAEARLKAAEGPLEPGPAPRPK